MSDEPYPDWAFDDMNVALDAAVARAELGRAHEFYAAQIEAAEAREAKLAEALRERAEAACEADCDSLSPLGPLHSVNCRAAYALLALYDAPAVQMPGDRHPQGE